MLVLLQFGVDFSQTNVDWVFNVAWLFRQTVFIVFGQLEAASLLQVSGCCVITRGVLIYCIGFLLLKGLFSQGALFGLSDYWLRRGIWLFCLTGISLLLYCLEMR